jgi:hypothetical protein
MILRAFGIFALWAAACALASCYLAEKPGTGSRAQTCYSAAAPIIVALEASHRDHGHYPPSLRQLTPRYLNEAATKLDTYYLHGFQYHSRDDEYRLGFRYDAAAINECEYDSKTKKWDCSGYF